MLLFLYSHIFIGNLCISSQCIINYKWTYRFCFANVSDLHRIRYDPKTNICYVILWWFVHDLMFLFWRSYIQYDFNILNYKMQYDLAYLVIISYYAIRGIYIYYTLSQYMLSFSICISSIYINIMCCNLMNVKLWMLANMLAVDHYVPYIMHDCDN